MHEGRLKAIQLKNMTNLAETARVNHEVVSSLTEEVASLRGDIDEMKQLLGKVLLAVSPHESSADEEEVEEDASEASVDGPRTRRKTKGR